MKKLLTTVSVVFAACAVNAASFTWGFYSSSIRDSKGNYLEGGTAFLYLGTVSSSSTAFNIGTATLLASIGQTSDDNFGNFDMSNLSSSDALTSTDAGQAYTLILLEKTGVSTLDGYEGKYILVPGESARGTIPGTAGVDTQYYADFTNDTAYVAGDWKTMAVPEPTSGLLLLIGVAGLALKRKRA